MPVSRSDRYQPESMLHVHLRQKAASPSANNLLNRVIKRAVPNREILFIDEIINAVASRARQVHNDTYLAIRLWANSKCVNDKIRQRRGRKRTDSMPQLNFLTDCIDER